MDTGSRDYISFLPDELLGKILSSIPTKQAASTSVLAQKWRNVFKLVHSLDFDNSVLLRPPGEGKGKRDENFRSFVNRTLALQCGSPVKRFSLKYHIREDFEMDYVCGWILDVVKRGVLELDVRINTALVKHFLPSQLFTSKTLVKLTLGTELYLGMLPSDAFLPSLTTLFVENVFFEYKHVCDVLLSCCPVLEELSIRYEDVKVPRNISSPTVKRLSVNYITCRHQHSGYRSLSLHLPNLVYLDYSGIALHKYPQVELDSLVEVKLDLRIHNMPDITNLLVGIRKVEILHLSRAFVHVISLCAEHGLLLPVFINLVNLSFGSYNKRSWGLLKNLIKQSSKLENLTIQDMNGYTGYVSMSLKKLKVLHVRGYYGTAEELKQLKSFLRRTRSLEVLQVDVAETVVGDEIKLDIMKLLGRSFSSKCKIIVT